MRGACVRVAAKEETEKKTMDENVKRGHVYFTALAIPAKDYVSDHDSEFSNRCREFTSTAVLDKLVNELNSGTLPVLCDHEEGTVAGYVHAATLTPGKGVLVTMGLDTTTQHGKLAATKVNSGEWSYVSLGHEFLASKDNGGGQNGITPAVTAQGYTIEKTAREVSCCKLGARSQTLVIEKKGKERWNEFAANGVVRNSASFAEKQASGTLR